MSGITIYEFDAVAANVPTLVDSEGLHSIPPRVYEWMESLALHLSEKGETAWLRLSLRRGRRVVQVTSFVGVIRAPNGFQIEVLPKIAKVVDGGTETVRALLVEMLRCLGGFRHIMTDSAMLLATRMPLLEVFIREYLVAVEYAVKRGLRSDYNSRQDNLYTLRGKLQIAEHLRRNLCRPDRFLTEYDEFSLDRPENRLLHAALRRALAWTSSNTNQQLAQELSFVFAEVPVSHQPTVDFQRVRLDRDMAHYDRAIAWARLILEDDSPLTGAGKHRAPSLLFPMEAVFEAYVAKHLSQQLRQGFMLRKQVSSLSLVRHLGQDWFRLNPDLLVQGSKENRLVLDTKWKLINNQEATGMKKYELAQGDFYQLNAYGQNYLDSTGDVVLIYPKTSAFNRALPVFEFPKSSGLRLWVLPFCLLSKRLLLPSCGSLDEFFASPTHID